MLTRILSSAIKMKHGLTNRIPTEETMSKMQRVTVPTVLEQKLFGTPITYSPHTAGSCREDLPAVRVKVDDGRIFDCQTCGRLNEFATVFVHGYAFPNWQFSWQAIADSLNTGRPLNGGGFVGGVR